MTRLLLALRLPVAFAIVAALFAFYPLCLETYRLALAPDGPLNIEGEAGHVLPIPRSIAWSPATKSLVGSLTLLAPGAVIGIAIALAAVLIYGMLRVLNGTFRLTTGVDWDRSVLTRTYIHTAPLIKAFLIFVAALVPIFIAWSALYYLTGSSFPAHAFRLVLVGSAAWLLFSREGVAGDFDSLNYDFPRSPALVSSLLVRGGLAGFGTAVISWLWRYTESPMLFDFYSSLGSVGEVHWRSIVLLSCGFAAGLGLALSAILLSLGPGNAPPASRRPAGIVAVLLLVVLWTYGSYFLPAFLASRYDYDPRRLDFVSPTSTRAARSLAQVSGVPTGGEKMDTVLVFRRGRLLSWNVPRAAVTGLDSSADAARKIEQYLQRKRFTTSLSDPAFKTMHDSASREWDSLASMKIDMLNLENCPDIFYVRLLVNKLRTVPRSNEAIAFVDALANEDRFACLTRNAQMVLGDLYARLGEADKAVVWYRKAGVPASRIAELQAARTMFTDGKMSGRLTHNGKPLSGARVGLAPFGIMREAVTLMLSPGVVRPYWFRWIGPTARTDSEGRFEITNIVAGEYRLLAAHPEVQFRPLDPSIRASGVPGRLFVGFGRPETRLGEIGIITNAETTQMSGAPSPP